MYISFNRDGQKLGILDREGTIHIWDVKTNGLQHVFSEYARVIGIRFHGQVSFSPDLRFLAKAHYDKHTDTYSKIYVLDAITGELLHTLYGHGNSVRSLSFSTDGKKLVSGSWDSTIRLWDVETGRLLQVPIIQERWIDCVSLSPDGQTLASGGSDGIVYLWDVETGEQKDTLTGNSSGVTNVLFSPDGETLAISRLGGTLYLWEIGPDPPEPERRAADINADGVVNVQDLVLVAEKFDQMGEFVEDVNGDGVVNIQDLVIVVSEFDE